MAPESQIIAEIPQDILGSSGSLLTSDVYAVDERQRRKRSEIAVGVDRQGINIYDIRQSRLVSCYAVSPQATFTCPPYSVRCRTGSGVPAYRLTYCSLRLPSARLYRFSEILNASSSLENQIAINFVDLEEKNSPIIHLETIPEVKVDGTDSSSNCLLAIHENGKTNCFTENIAKKLWSWSISDGEDQQVLLSRLADVTTARRGLLKHREDVLASLGQIEPDQPRDLLVLLTSSNHPQSRTDAPKLSLQIFDIGKVSVDGKGPGFRPRNVFSIDVPHTGTLELEKSTFIIHLATGYLYQQTPNSVIVFDMADLLPKVVHEVVVGKSVVSSFLRLSSQTLALGRQSSFSLVSLPYCSIQGETSAEALPMSGDGALRLVSHFESLKTIVAIKGRSLIAMQLPKSHLEYLASGKRKREGSLADSIGRGSYAKRTLPFSNEASNPSVKSLGTLSTLSKDEAWETQKAKWAHVPSSGLHELSKSMIEELDMLNPKSTVPVDQRKVSYLLSRIFIVQRPKSVKDEKPDNRVYLKFFCPDRKTVFKWLLHKGYLTKHRIEDSLRQNNSLYPFESLPPTALIEALSKEHNASQLLTLVLSSSIRLDPIELVFTLSIVIQRHQVSESQENKPDHPKAINPNNKTHTLPTSTYQLLLNLLLNRFFLFPSSAISSALRTILSKPTLLSLIDTFRLQIATAGWFTPYDNSPTNPYPATPNNHLTQTTHLLNSTIDAIGTGGWILGSSSWFSSIINKPKDNGNTDGDVGEEEAEEEVDALTQSANTLSHMKAEVAAALEGIQEAVYLQGMLRDVLLCGKDALAEQEQLERSKSKTKAKKEKKEEKKTDVDSTVAIVDKTAGNGQALPLGLKAVRTVLKTRVGPGGRIEGRTRRAIEREKSRMVGVYSFERIKV